MLKKRIVASLVVKDGIVVQSINFKKYLPVGKPAIAIEFLNLWGIDEIIMTDISASRNGTGPNFDLIRKASEKCYVPLTVGGGITSTNQIKELMHCGADKISINQSAIYQNTLISKAAHIFGNQCIVVSIDVVKEFNSYKVYDYIKKRALKISAADFAKQAEEAGAGEILLNSVDRDGSYIGYDHELINTICHLVKIPVICCGGAKNALDFINVFSKTKASAASAANFFHFTEHSVNTTKTNINKYLNIRFETHADYIDSEFDEEYRLKKKPDQILEEMLYVRIEKEII
jgi:cyclase